MSAEAPRGAPAEPRSGASVRGPVRLAVLGDPLAFTLSPVLHRAGAAALGIDAQSEALPTPPHELETRLAALAAAGYRGVNLTNPHKEAALRAVAHPSQAARRARSVNTIGFERAGWWGDTTDGAGFLEALEHVGRPVEPGACVVVLGAGGAARSIALALAERAARVTVAARRPDAAAPAWADLDVTPTAWPSLALDAALAEAVLVVNATPESTADAPIAPARLPRLAVAIDLTYRDAPTPWVMAARAAGLDAWDGLGMLIGQARRSLGRWLGAEPPFEALARAVGWPR